jgi:predicted secreted protein
MASKVDFEIPQSELGKAAARFEAFKDGRKIGTLKIRKGSLEWYPRYQRKRIRKLTWEQFAERMERRSRFS